MTSDGNGNYIIPRIKLWIALISALLVLCGATYAWGCTFTALRAEVLYQHAAIVSTGEDVKEIKELLVTLSEDVAVLKSHAGE